MWPHKLSVPEDLGNVLVSLSHEFLAFIYACKLFLRFDNTYKHKCEGTSYKTRNNVMAGPWNIFDDKDIKGEAGTLACAASPAANPDLIYAGGQNNGVSSGIIKTTDGLKPLSFRNCIGKKYLNISRSTKYVRHIIYFGA